MRILASLLKYTQHNLWLLPVPSRIRIPPTDVGWTQQSDNLIDIGNNNSFVGNCLFCGFRPTLALQGTAIFLRTRLVPNCIGMVAIKGKYTLAVCWLTCYDLWNKAHSNLNILQKKNVTLSSKWLRLIDVNYSLHPLRSSGK